jgi:glycine betaine catabolism A
LKEAFMPSIPPAPLDQAQLALSLAPFGSSRMLPRDAYLSPDVLAWERQHLFSGWMCLGRSAQIKPGGLRAESVGEYGVLLTRDLEGELRAFENACRHRGHELLPCGGSADAKAIVCPYHAWSYRHDGSLIGAPHFKNIDETYDRSTLGLKPVRVQEWHGWVFVDRSGTAEDFASYIGELEGIVAPYDAGSLVTCETHEYDVEANWKVIVENYQECYHCSMIHPELCRVSPPTSGENIERPGAWVGGWMDLREGAVTMSLDGTSKGATIARLDEQEQHTVMYVAVLPNLLISLHPDYVMTHLLTPITPDLTRISCSWAFPPDVVEREDFDPSYAVDFWDLTNKQDWAACEGVQRGIKAPSFVAGPLAPEEDGVYQFVSFMARKYAGEPV